MIPYKIGCAVKMVLARGGKETMIVGCGWAESGRWMADGSFLVAQLSMNGGLHSLLHLSLQYGNIYCEVG
jgi:hypothetical protein